MFGGLFLVVPLFFAVAMAFTASGIVLLAIGVTMAVFGYRKGGAPYWIEMMRGSAYPIDAASPWVAGPAGSSGGGSSSGGSFGGGSSGGGGASGSW